MADTYTTNLNLTKPEPGAAEDTWGISLNSDLDTLDAIFSSSGTQVNLNPNQVNFADNKKAVFNSNLNIFSTGTSSYIEEVGSGDLYLKASNLYITDRENNQFVSMIDNGTGGTLSLKHLGSTVLTTTSTGVAITGNATFDDNGKAIFGTGSDLQIYHDGTDSYIKDVGTGNLIIEGSSQLKLTGPAGDYFMGQNNGSAYLYHAGSLKAYTTSTGIDVTGTTVTDALTVQTVQGDISIANSAAVIDMKRAGTNYILASNSSGNLRLGSGNNFNRINITSGGDIAFYDDTGTTQGLFWDASAESLCLGNTSAGAKLDIRQDSGYAIRCEDGLGHYFRVASGGATEIGGNVDVTGTVTADGLTVDGGVSINSGLLNLDTGYAIRWGGSASGIYSGSGNSDMVFTAGSSERFRVNGLSGNVGIGTNNPSSPLSVHSALVGGAAIAEFRSTGNVNATIDLRADGTGDPKIFFDLNGATPFAIGVDNSDGDKFKISGNYQLGTNDRFVIDSSGNVGIGNTSPAKNLHITDSTSPTIRFSRDNSFYWDIGHTSSDFQFISETGGTILHMNYDGNVGIGTTAPRTKLHISGLTGDDDPSLGSSTAPLFVSNTANSYGLNVGVNVVGDAWLQSQSNTAATAYNLLLNPLGGNVGIGIASPAAPLDVRASTGDLAYFIPTTTGHGSTYISSSSNKAEIGTGLTSTEFSIRSKGNGGFLTFDTSGTERARIDSSGNLLVGTTSTTPAFGTGNGTAIRTGEMSHISRSGGTALAVNRASSDGDIVSFRKDGSSVGSIGTKSGDLVLGTGDTGIRFDDANNAIYAHNTSTNGYVDDAISLGFAGIRFKDLHLSGNVQMGGNLDVVGQVSSYDNVGASYGTMNFRATDYIYKNGGGSEKMRLDTSGNLLVSTTNTAPATNNVAGIALRNEGHINVSRSSGVVGYFNRITNDGTILDFRKDGSTVGRIGTYSGGLVIGNGDTGLRMQDSINAIYAFNVTTGANRDDAIDLGAPSVRFQDIYATNGTIQTSDINEKQDIEDLSEAETRVAVAAKGLLKKYRWKSAVADKGDDARIHFGIMAQDLENAFANEGLDAGDYGMFISSTWTDEATGEEKTRLGVRYNELLAFIIAAI